MIIDAHTHVGAVTLEESHLESEEVWPDPGNLQVDYDHRTTIMDQNDIDQAVIMPTATYDRSEGIDSTRRINNSVRDIVQQHDRFACGIGTIEPTHGQLALGELERIADLGLKGVGWHHRLTGTVIDNPTTKQALERLDDLNLVALVHASSPLSDLEDIVRIKNIAGRTDQPIIILTATYHLGNIETIIQLGNEFENLYFDTAMMAPVGHVIETLVDGLGSNRIVFGSNFYTRPLLYDHSTTLFQIRNADISEEERELILSKNISNILSL